MDKDRAEFSRVVGTKIPPGFGPAECCEICKHCHVHCGYDDPVTYYCNVDGQMPEEPDISSLSLDDMKTKEYRQKSDAFDNWRNTHEVFAGGHCDRCSSRKVALKTWIMFHEEMSGATIILPKTLDGNKKRKAKK